MSSDFILSKENEKQLKEYLNQIIDLGIEFKLKENFKEKIISDELKQKLFEMPINSNSMNNIIELVEKEIIPYCSNFGSAKFMGFPDAGNSIAAISGAVLSDLIQQNLINSSFCAPIATYIEIAVIQWLREIIGYKNAKINNVGDIGALLLMEEQ